MVATVRIKRVEFAKRRITKISVTAPIASAAARPVTIATK
jgi:hypothetical protein